MGQLCKCSDVIRMGRQHANWMKAAVTDCIVKEGINHK